MNVEASFFFYRRFLNILKDLWKHVCDGRNFLKRSYVSAWRCVEVCVALNDRWWRWGRGGWMQVTRTCLTGVLHVAAGQVTVPARGTRPSGYPQHVPRVIICTSTPGGVRTAVGEDLLLLSLSPLCLT